jgi:hypothetical protein
MFADPIYGFGWFDMRNGTQIETPSKFRVNIISESDEAITGSVIDDFHIFSGLSFSAKKRHKDEDSLFFIIDLFGPDYVLNFSGSIFFDKAGRM